MIIVNKHHLLTPKSSRNFLETTLASASSATPRSVGCLGKYSAMKRVKLLCWLMLCLMVVASSPASAQSLYGSIAFSEEYGGGYAWGMAWSYGTLSEAQNNAISECRRKGGTNCGEIVWFRDACGALAIGDNGGYGSGWGTSYGIAQQYALNTCQSYGNRNCRIAITRCVR